MNTTLGNCDFDTLLALAEQMPPERFEQLKVERPDFAAWLQSRRGPPAKQERKGTRARRKAR